MTLCPLDLGVNPKYNQASGFMKISGVEQMSWQASKKPKNRTSGALQKGVMRLQLLLVAAALLLALGLAGSPGAWAKGPFVQGDPAATNPAAATTISQSQLPPQGRSVLALIAAGGPFQHGKDGTVFGNRERLLPAHPRGFYREYTVRTPGERSRGARRIVCGGTQPVQPEACYYTADHYASFKKIVP